MRFLMIHVNSFRSRITEKGRSKLVEPPEPEETAVGEALLVLSSVETGDEADTALVARRAAGEIGKNAKNLKAGVIVLHPFAHLFARLAAPETAVEIMDMVRDILRGEGYEVIRTPFGWFNTLEMDAKGHPYSRVARVVTAEPQ
ncbi:threonyl-tRNA synthetase [Desulfocucumis palustris]|uniref:Threonyl-tRNA synthetase n=1 Tax=Desulfocucumis palustris TaxID=1898651 RepID=A0A2L2XB80_9FIRM|nr:threonyl-tRNA synthetase editing domain-containing protein [Desulfocucumis palustris]GBF32933.1 threonyl-tRNA synthetase [Desulfocucumis palustris]